MKHVIAFCCSAMALGVANAQTSSITVQADKVLHRVTPYLTGACIEDVNHELYGGIDSQMIFGESFAEPATELPVRDFTAHGGRWTVTEDGHLQSTGGGGAKLVWKGPELSDGEVSVDIMLTEAGGGNGGFILKVQDVEGDAFTGYVVALERPGELVFGRHRGNWEPITRLPCDVPVDQWINLAVKMTGRTLEVFVDGKSMLRYEDTEHPLEIGSVGLRVWQHRVLFRNLVIDAGTSEKIVFDYDRSDSPDEQVSGMWRPIREGDVQGGFSLVTENPFSGRQSQRIEFADGSGIMGIENQSLNRWGMNFAAGRGYEGFLYARSEEPAELIVALESSDGTAVHAEEALRLDPGKWQKLDFEFVPNAADTEGRFSIRLKKPGTVDVGYAFLQPGEWGRFQGLPVRKDVGEGLVKQGVTALRLGGGMSNARGYRWKRMIGPREMRPPYEGSWYPYSSLGWGIFEFLDYCEAAGILGIPNLNIKETPEDMADFVEYVNGPPDSKWGSKRVENGHPKPYDIKIIQLGNEERVDDDFFEKFKSLAEAIWAKDPGIILVVGDFVYDDEITDPFNVTGAGTHITTMAAHQKILQLAKKHDAEVWFDVHINTDGPQPRFGGFFSYADALEKLADGAKHKLVTFEFNANNHAHRRALGNAGAIIQIERDGRIPIATSANCLQPDGQNDNGWDQGLLFLNPSKTWLQPPGYVTQMVSSNYLPLVVESESSNENIAVAATRSTDGKTLVLQIVNVADKPATISLEISGFVPTKPTAKVQTLSGGLDDRNTAENPEAVKPVTTDWNHGLNDGRASLTVPAHSFSVVRF